MQRSNHYSHSLSRSLGGWFGAGLMGSTLLMVSPAAAINSLSAWQFNPATRQFTVTLPQGTAPRFLVAAEPARIILEIPQTRLGPVESEASYEGAIRSIRLSETDGNTLRVVLELAPGTVLSPNHAQLTSMASGDQTRWVLTPLVATGTLADETGLENINAISTAPPASTPPSATPGSTATNNSATAGQPSLPFSAVDAAGSLPPLPQPEALPNQAEPVSSAPTTGMVVELPVIPAAEPGLGFPEAGQGRLSTTAANLMLPSDVDDLDNLPDTLPIDPFSTGTIVTEQVTVPGLDQLDAATGPVATVPAVPGAGAEGVTPEAAVVTDPITDPTAGEPIEVITAEGNDSLPGAAVETAEATDLPAMEAPALTSTPGNPQAITAAPPAAAAEDTVDLAVVPVDPVPAAEPEASPTPPSQVDTSGVTAQPLSASQSRPTGVISQAPPAVAAPVTNSPATAAGVSPSRDLLNVPELPTTNARGTVVPPSNVLPREVVVAASEPINFGQPLPGTSEVAVLNPAEPRAVPPANQEIPPDILIAAGTVLELRYPGSEPLVLEPGTNLNEVMLLESAIVDPITQGVLAPRGSQLIGQFQPNGTNQQWVSEMIIVPAGQRVPLASTSETLVGTPQIEGGRLAAGSGAGALALALLTGFSGIGLIGGAIVGATTMVGTSPQQVVIEPNQIIAVQVTENVPRAMPIAAGPDLSREWGAE